MPGESAGEWGGSVMCCDDLTLLMTVQGSAQRWSAVKEKISRLRTTLVGGQREDIEATEQRQGSDTGRTEVPEKQLMSSFTLVNESANIPFPAMFVENSMVQTLWCLADPVVLNWGFLVPG
jgi:hypothetical protein